MSSAGIVTIVLVVVAIVVVALFLIRIATVLRQISRSLGAVIGVVAAIPEKTEPIAPVLSSINADLGIARGVLEGLLAKKRGAPRDPSRIAQRRSHEDRPRPAPGGPDLTPEAEPDPSRIVHRRQFEPAPEPDPMTHLERGPMARVEPELELAPPPHLEPVPGPPPPDDRPHFSAGRIVYRHEAPGAVAAPPPPHRSQDTSASEPQPNVIRYRRRGQ